MTVYLPKIIRTVNQNARRPCLRQFSSKTDNYRLYSEQRIVGYSCEQMYSVVSEVERYHSFVPWCKKSVVKKSKNNNEQLVAELVVGFPPFGESYTSTVTLVKPYLVTGKSLSEALIFASTNPQFMTTDCSLNYKFNT